MFGGFYRSVFTDLLIDCGRSISPLFSCLVIFPIGLIILVSWLFYFWFISWLFVCLFSWLISCFYLVFICSWLVG